MVRRITEDSARLDVFRPDNRGSDPDITVPAGHIESAKIPRTLGPLKDQATFTLDNHGGRYRTGNTIIRGGERVEFWVRLGPESGVGVPEAVRTGQTDDGPVRRCTGVLRVPETTLGHGEQSTLSFTAEDYVGFVLSNATVEAGFENRQVAGPPDAILNTILRQECPEIDRSGIQPIDKRTSITFNATLMLKAVRRLLARGDVVLSSTGRTIETTPLSSVAAEWNLTDADRATEATFGANDDGMANAVRVDGGTVPAVGAEQLAVDSWTTVTETDRTTHLLDMPKSEITQIEVWTDPRRTASGDGMVVRLQRDADDGTGPEDVTDTSLDFARRTLAAEFLAEDDFTTFLLPEHDIVDHRVWLIVETDSEGDGSGQAHGVNTAGTPAFRAYYPFPVSARVTDRESIEKYRRREVQIADESLHSRGEVADAARATLNERNVLSREASFEAASLRAHTLLPSEGIWVDEPRAGVAADYVVTKREDTYEGGSARLSTDLTLQDIKTL